MSLKKFFNTTLSEINTSPLDTLGDLRIEDGKWYKYVEIRNTTATVAGVAGDPVAYFALTGVANHRVVIDLSDADAVPVPAGLLMGSVAGVHTPTSVSYYGWIQLTGSAVVPTAITNGVVGRPVCLTTTDKTLQMGAEVDTLGPYKQTCGVELTATAANNQILCQFPH